MDLERAAAVLRRGGLVAFPTETVYEDGEVEIREVFHLRDHFKQEDLFDYGMQPQFLSRFDNALILEDLHADLLRRIFLEPRDSVYKASRNFFRRYEIDLDITDGAIHKIAIEASTRRRIGARALKAVWGRVIKPFEFDPFAQDQVKKDGGGYRLVIPVPSELTYWAMATNPHYTLRVRDAAVGELMVPGSAVLRREAIEQEPSPAGSDLTALPLRHDRP